MAPSSLRGHMDRWLLEISEVSARVRALLWNHVPGMVKAGARDHGVCGR
ncbi:type I-E CRISPR-associated endoribonuclease Cas2 [Amycolatopsis ponsaeliensis]